MKQALLFLTAGAAATLLIAVCVVHILQASPPQQQTAYDSAPIPPAGNARPVPMPNPLASPQTAPGGGVYPAATAPVPRRSPYSFPAADLTTAPALAYRQAFDVVISPQSTFSQRQAAWKQLRDAGQLDQAITELQERLAADPQASEYSTALAEAYLKKTALTDDIRQKAILAMNADQLFDAALALNPSDWEARYVKAVGMSYWPASLNKGNDVVANFQTLIQQQQSLPQQPEFALPYLKLGDQYQTMGNADAARQAWAQGAQLFPGNQDLQNKLAAAH